MSGKLCADIVAPRSGFQGLKISQMTSAVAMKLSPSPAKFSWTRALTRRTPVSSPHSARRSAGEVNDHRRGVCGKVIVRMAHVAKTAPKMICPSAPIFTGGSEGQAHPRTDKGPAEPRP